MKRDKKSFSRRDFVKTTAVGVSATALAGMGGSKAQAAQIPVTWDKEADVVVIGYGAAGVSAAIEACDAGAKVIILEKLEIPGGCTRTSGGGWVTPLNIDEAIKYYDAIRQGTNVSHELIEVMVREGAKNFDYVKQWGGTWSQYGGATYPGYPGASSIGKYHIDGPLSSCENYWKLHTDVVKARGKDRIEVMLNTPAKELITGRNNEILGVRVESGGWDRYIKASRAVILTTGGWEFSEERLRDFVNDQPYLSSGAPGNTGDGLAMAEKVGARLWNMTTPLWTGLQFAYPDLKGSYLSPAKPTGAYIYVNKYGKRALNEASSGTGNAWKNTILTYVQTTEGRIEYPFIPATMIFDEQSRSKGPMCSAGGYVGIFLYQWSKNNLDEIAKGWITKADTLVELGTKLGIDAAALTTTVNTFNQCCVDKKDPEFGRSAASLVPINTPPFYAMKLWPGFMTTEGGPKRNAKAQVVDPFDKPIPRLYEAGELGSIAGFLYQGANTLGLECMAMGRIAGRNAAAEEPWG